MRRHKDIAIRTPERVSKARTGITETSIKGWFSDLRNNLTLLGEEEILSGPIPSVQHGRDMCSTLP